MLAPTEQPVYNLAFMTHLERDQQPVGRFLFARDVIRTRFLYPARNLSIEERSYHYRAGLALAFRVLVHYISGGALKCLGKEFKPVDAVEAKVADVLA